MGKVYEALRRAEQERSQQLTPGAPPLPTMMPRRETVGVNKRALLWRRWLGRDGPRGIAEDAVAVNKRRITLLRPESFVSEQFRSLRARLDSISSEMPLRTLAMTSAIAGEGKTIAAVNLALVSAMSVGKRVLLVDCDLRRPKVQAALGLQVEAGLAEVLTDRASLEDAIVEVEGVNLEVLAVRAQPQNPSELLASERMRTLMEAASQAYDRVILDTPPVLAVPDAKSVGDLSDGILLVVQAGTTPSEDVAAALDILDRQRIVGVVLNGVDDASDHYGYPG